MKRPIFSLLSFVLTISIFAQDNAPNSFNWQGVFRGADNILTNTPIQKSHFPSLRTWMGVMARRYHTCLSRGI